MPALRYKIICVGRRAKDPLLDATDDYLKRLGRFVSVELVRLRESRPNDEAALILAKIEGGDFVVILDERGRSLSTAQLAAEIDTWQQLGRSVAFVIGGAEGLSPAVKERGNLHLCLSAMTLPHRLAQTLLAEQLYRAHTLIAGLPYHRP